MKDYLAIVMAAGLSRRSGFQKLLKDLNGKKLYEYIFDTLSELDFAEVLVVSNLDELKTSAKRLNFSHIYNPEAESGKASTIRLGTEYFVKRIKDKSYEREIKGIYFFVCDQPFISKETILDIRNKFELEGSERIIYPVYIGEQGKKRRGNPIVFPLESCQLLMELRGDEGGVKLIDDGFASKSLELERFQESADFDRAEDFKTL